MTILEKIKELCSYYYDFSNIEEKDEFLIINLNSIYIKGWFIDSLKSIIQTSNFEIISSISNKKGDYSISELLNLEIHIPLIHLKTIHGNYVNV